MINPKFVESIDKNIVLKINNKFINLNNLEDINNSDLEYYIKCIYIINLIFKRLNIDLEYKTFFIDISNIDYHKKISDYIDIDYDDNNNFKTKDNKDTNKKVFKKFIDIIDKIPEKSIKDLINFKNYELNFLDNDFSTYCPDYLNYLKEELLKNEYLNQIKDKTFFEKLYDLFFNFKSEDNIQIDDTNYNKNLIEKISLDFHKSNIDSDLLQSKENFYIDFSDFT